MCLCSVYNKKTYQKLIWLTHFSIFFCRKRVCGFIFAYKRQKQCIPTLIIFVFTLNVFFSPNKEGKECFTKLKTHLDLWFLNVKPKPNTLEFNLVCFWLK